ncbi:MAG: DUF3857 domain-containing protein [Algicola sp.]|nr:DUF3857 domain-containing protein [Algicola sp.]
MQRLFFLIFFILIYTQTIAQDTDLFKVSTVPLELRKKSNAVVRSDHIHIDISSYNNLVYSNQRIITVLNKEGDLKVGAFQYYDENVKIKSLEARIFNAQGKEIKKIKKNDFKDVSAVPGGTLYSDNRVKYLDYTPIHYPYTVLFETEVVYSSTAFIPGWRPIEGFYTSTQHAEYKITNTSGVPLKIKTSNFENYKIKKVSETHFMAEHLNAIKPEAYSPDFKTYAPILRAALTEFDMNGVKGVNNTWADFGLWVNQALLKDTQELPDETKVAIKQLTEGIDDNIEKAKIVYQYMQDKTRYISVQVGIGGWKPIKAEDVDRLGYGDCKGLTNYTKALLKEVGVESYYTVIYGDKNLKSIDDEFSATQGNHAILCLPHEEDYIWLECTSQTNPFGFIAGFTDDRNALIITPEGGEIVRTTIYNREENTQKTSGTLNIFATGHVTGEVTIETNGYQYAMHKDIQTIPEKKLAYFYKQHWDYLNNLEINAVTLNNNKEAITFTENLKITINNHAKKSGPRLLMAPNTFNRVTTIPTRYDSRTLNFEIERGFEDYDEFKLTLAPELMVEAMPEPVTISNAFGTYRYSISQINDSTLLYKRAYALNKGHYPKEDYKAFRDFMAEIVKYDNAKIVLKITP